MKLISWNVNGIRAIMKKGFLASIKKENPDILALQETKGKSEEADDSLSLTYNYRYWHVAQRKGYSGTAVFSKAKPLNATFGIGNEDKEGRVITLEFTKFFFVNVYTPNSGRGLPRLEYRQQWDKDFLSYIKKLEKKKPVVFCGDLNVAHKEIDIANPKQNVKNAGFTPEERAGFDRLMGGGFIDTFREFEKGPGHYTWWTYRFNARKRNIGWRIDYFCASKKLKPKLKKASILKEIEGSDHCPVALEISI